MEMTRQRQTESVRASVHDDCFYCQGKGKVKSVVTMSVEIHVPGEILKKAPWDESDYQLMIVVNPKVFNRLRTEDEQICDSDGEKSIFRKLSFRPRSFLSLRGIQDRRPGKRSGTGSLGILIEPRPLWQMGRTSSWMEATSYPLPGPSPGGFMGN